MFRAYPWPRAGQAVLFFALVCAGCGESGPRVVRVTGTVTRKGQPVEKIVVTFVPEKGRQSWGATDAQGHYRLHHDRREGALVGTHHVWVQVRPKTPKEEADLAAGTLKLHPEIEQILEKYGNQGEPAITVEVKNEDPQVIDLKLD